MGTSIYILVRPVLNAFKFGETMRLQTFAFFQFFILMSNCIQTHTYYESQFVFSHQQADFCTLSDMIRWSFISSALQSAIDKNHKINGWSINKVPNFFSKCDSRKEGLVICVTAAKEGLLGI